MSEESHEHDDAYYIKTWILLVVLLVVSVMGPMLEIKVVTFVTAFGIAVVKAGLVANRFMHLNIEKKYITSLLLTGVAAIVMLYFGVAPDVMNHSGEQWENVASQQWVEDELAAAEASPGHHGEAATNHEATHGETEAEASTH